MPDNPGTRPRLVVIGNGMVGQRLLESLTAAAPSAFDITVVGEEPRRAYDRVHLSALFEARTAADLELAGETFFAERRITLHLAEAAAAIDRERHTVRTGSGALIPYDKLVLATGSYPFVPPIPGRESPHCLVYRTIEDVERIRAAAQGAGIGVVIGGGLLGLEAAKALKDLGLTTHVVEFAPRLMTQQVDEGGGRILRTRIESLGVTVHTGKVTAGIVSGDGDGTRLTLEFTDSGRLAADLVVFSAGIRPRDELARAAGLALGDRGGVVIDDCCRTSDPDVYAVGECAVRDGRVYGLVAPGYQMAEVAAAHLAGIEGRRFDGADGSTKLKLLGVDVGSLGDAHGNTPGAKAYTFIDERRQVYKKMWLSEDGSRLIGGVLVGDAADYGVWQQYLLNGIALPQQPEQLILPTAGGAGGAALGVEALPAAAQICSCNNVSKSDLCAAIAAGSTSLGALKKSTKAATACGGCAPLVTQVLKAELKRRGVAVDDHLCEHFPYSRQQIYHLARVGGLRSFADVLGRHGKGLGCDVCKPAIASILASQWNEFVLAPERVPLQDTNDRFLANIQKDGTYSVVPRIPGGEITPEKLIAIGEVARRYRLYTKITGGQRIDLFGARLHELPAIWRELIDAGFESGHAYGKAMRTVKSCVGSTWCRYGVQDSVALAIRLENRYRGLRAPHKIKLAVSGCTRECAEAQGKDVGVIATEKGWNLYVCGNGGMRPRHADLLASDLDAETLVRYVDRFLMFYVRTAERLQRTATWLENLVGGIDYLRDVVCGDSLGIGADLEAEMAQIVASYECEWRRAVEDPATVRRFRHFVNADDADEDVMFVEERGQIRPATPAERAARREAIV